MKKIVLFIGLFLALGISSSMAQQYALIDMEYILKRIPAYENANEQLEALSKQWQAVIDEEVQEVNAMYKNTRPISLFLQEKRKPNVKIRL
jgi:outer membrane protein